MPRLEIVDLTLLIHHFVVPLLPQEKAYNLPLLRTKSPDFRGIFLSFVVTRAFQAYIPDAAR